MNKLIKKTSFIITICLINVFTTSSIISAAESYNMQQAAAISAPEAQVIKLVNAERSKRGLKVLNTNLQLSKVSRIKSQDMINKHYFSHTSPTYGSPFAMMKRFGITFTAAGENIAMGQTTAQAVMKSWMNSAGHKRNILSPTFNQLGVGLAKNGSGRCYWTQMFIKK